MSTLRGRLPVLLSECVARGITINFDFFMGEPLISWRYENGKGGHHHLPNFVPGVHGDNMLEFEKVLTWVLAEAEEGEE